MYSQKTDVTIIRSNRKTVSIEVKPDLTVQMSTYFCTKSGKFFCTITCAMLQPPESPDRLVYPSNDMTVLL